MGAAELAGPDDALRALRVPFASGALTWPGDGVLFLGARADPELLYPIRDRLHCEQDFKPFVEALERAGLCCDAVAPTKRFGLVMALLPRQRDQRRGVLARAVGHVSPGGTVLVAVANAEGARSAQDDLAALAGSVQARSKHKCRVFWTHVTPDGLRADVLQAWQAADALRRNAEGLWSRPGLFAWDRVDAGSRLLGAHFPSDLAGRAADFGAGSGYLSMQLLQCCPDIVHVDLYEADRRALPAAQANLDALAAARFTLHWHDVVAGVEGPLDVVVSNVPFHQGHAGQPELGQAFVRAAAAALRPGGRFWMVANRHLPYESTLRASFANVCVRADQDGFKVIEAQR